MDWSKAKNILLLLFIILNIFLFVNLLLYNRDQGVSRSNLLNTIRVLNERGYILDVELPDDSESYWLEYEKGIVDRNKVIRELLGDEAVKHPDAAEAKIVRQGSASIKFDEGVGFTYNNDSPDEEIDLSDRTELVKHVRDILDRLDLPFYEYALEDFTSLPDGTVSIVFRDRYKGHIVMHNEVKAIVDEKGLKELECRYVKVRGFGPKLSIIPAYKILLVNLQNVDDAKITDIDLVYKCTLENEDTSASTTPIWRISFEDGKARYFHSIKGTELLDMEK